MQARIVRGAVQVGGSCIELACGGARLVLDLGLPLDGDDQELPPIVGDDLLGVVISHAHPDHMGLVPVLPDGVPVYGPAVAQRMQLAGVGFTGAAPPDDRRWQPLADGECLQLGPFAITPLAVDHSAYESYALCVEAGGRRLLYTGDVRAHGRKPGMWQRLLSETPRPVHALLLEGTTLSRDGASSMSEQQVELKMAERCRGTRGAVLVSYSGQHIDRLVTVYRAAERAGRTLVLDAYGAAIAAAAERATIPQAEWDEVRVFLPHAQRRRIIERQAFADIEAFGAHRIYPEQLRAQASSLVITMRGSMTADLDRADCLDGASAIWSMWAGYLGGASGRRYALWCKARGMQLTKLHASGHANPDDLRVLATTIRAERVVPVHTAAPERYTELFERVEVHGDGEWWPV